MSQDVSEFLLSRLAQWGIRRIYGYPGDGINGILGALGRGKSEIRFVQTRHEELAAFMACAHAKFTGEIGVCLATSGPGAIHLLNGLYDAKMDHQPVLAIVGQASRHAMGGDYQQEVDLHTLFKDVAHHYVHTCNHPGQVRHLVDRAVRIARARRTVTCLIFPKDVQELAAVEVEAHAHDTLHSSVHYSEPRVVPRQADLAAAARILNEGERVAMLVGQGALGATDEVVAVADTLGAGIAKALLGIAAVPDDVPGVTGSIGLLGTRPSWDLMQRCDTLLMVGSSFPYSEFLPKEGQARAIQIDLDPTMLGIRYPMELNLVGDSAETLRALLPLLERKTDRRWQEKLIAGVAAWRELLAARALGAADPINPQLLFRKLSERLPDDCIITADSGSAANWFARDLQFRRGMLASLSGNLATMGPGVPYAIAAKFAYPDRVVVACVGDGAMQMNGLNGLITLAKYCDEWSDKRLIVIVLNNRDLNQVTWEQRAMSGDPRTRRRSCAVTPTPAGSSVAPSARCSPSWRARARRRSPDVAHPRGATIPVERVSAQVFTVPTDRRESDGTFAWDRTTLILARVFGGGLEGLGYTYAHAAAAELIEGPLARVVIGADTMHSAGTWRDMSRALRNLGRPGLGWEALSALDVALWDLKARLLDVSLATLLGPARASVPIYGSGGFTSYTDAELDAQLAGWAALGITMVKMKVGRDPASDPHRVAVARAAIGPDVALFVDANGAWTRKQALAQLAAFAPFDLRWVEEPVVASDLDGLRFVRDHTPAGIDVAAGEYGYLLPDFRRMLHADCVDVLMADATRCGGVTGLLAVAALAEAHDLPLSTHCAPQLHAHVGVALRPLRHLEYFHDHARVERLLFEGALEPVGGQLVPDLSRPGLGLALRDPDAARYAA